MKNPFTETTEKQLREQIRDLCKLMGWKFYFTFTSIHSPRGMPDLILCKPPRLIFAELKTEKGQLSDYQREWIASLIACGGNVECYLWRPSDIENIAKILQGSNVVGVTPPVIRE
jgi:hypothetical protein